VSVPPPARRAALALQGHGSAGPSTPGRPLRATPNRPCPQAAPPRADGRRRAGASPRYPGRFSVDLLRLKLARPAPGRRLRRPRPPAGPRVDPGHIGQSSWTGRRFALNGPGLLVLGRELWTAGWRADPSIGRLARRHWLLRRPPTSTGGSPPPAGCKRVSFPVRAPQIGPVNKSYWELSGSRCPDPAVPAAERCAVRHGVRGRAAFACRRRAVASQGHSPGRRCLAPCRRRSCFGLRVLRSAPASGCCPVPGVSCCGGGGSPATLTPDRRGPAWATRSRSRNFLIVNPHDRQRRQLRPYSTKLRRPLIGVVAIRAACAWLFPCRSCRLHQPRRPAGPQSSARPSE